MFEAPGANTRVRMPSATKDDFISYFRKHENRMLFATCGSWFFQDVSLFVECLTVAHLTSPHQVAFYALTFNANAVLLAVDVHRAAFPDNSATLANARVMYQLIYGIAASHAVVSTAALLSGYYATYLLIDVWWQKPIQLMGFAVYILFTVLGAVCSLLRGSVRGHSVLFFLYCLISFFQNFGPTLRLHHPCEAFPTRYRSTAHGLSAASGRLGAILAQVIIYGFTRHDVGGLTKICPALFHPIVLSICQLVRRH